MNINWKEYKEEELLKIKNDIEINNKDITLAIIEVGHNPSSDIYIRNKMNACNKVGIKSLLINFDENIEEEKVIEKIEELNKDNKVNGILVQLPLPSSLNENKIVNKVDYKKDVDGLTKTNYSNLVFNNEAIKACTAKGVMEMLEVLKVNLDGKKVCLIGRSHLVGLPLFHMLLKENATVTICHRHTTNLKEITLSSDIIISAAGSTKNLITKDMVNEDSIIIDVAISKDENGKIYGDADYENLKSYVKYITPVPGGVGQLTVLELIKNVVYAFDIQKNN